MSFAQNLRALRKARGMTQKDLGMLIGKSSRVISYYENEESGSTIPDVDTLKLLAKHFNVSVDDLIGTKRERPKVEALVDKLLEYTVDGDLTWTCLEDFHQDPNYDIFSELITEFIVEHFVQELKNDKDFRLELTQAFILFGVTDYFLYFDNLLDEYYLLAVKTSVYNETVMPESDFVTITNVDVQGKLEKLYRVIKGDKNIQKDVQIELMIHELDLRCRQKEDDDTPLPFDF